MYNIFYFLFLKLVFRCGILYIQLKFGFWAMHFASILNYQLAKVFVWS